MSIADYSDLLIQCGEYTGRNDFGHMFPRFVSYAENKLNRRLRVSGMETSATLTTATDGTVALPADFNEFRQVKRSTGEVLSLVVPNAADYDAGPYSGTPRFYYIKGGTFYAKPTAAETFSVVYYAKIDPLTSSNTSNWLLEDAPLIYLYAVSAEIAGWALASGKASDMGRVSAANDLLRAEIDSYTMNDKARRFGNSRVVVRGVNP